MAFDLDLSLTVEIKDGATRLAYGAHALSGEGHDEYSAGVLEVDDGASGVAVPLGGVTTASAVWVKSDFAISLAVNGGAAQAGKCFLITGASVTALAVSNASGSKATVRYALAGT